MKRFESGELVTAERMNELLARSQDATLRGDPIEPEEDESVFRVVLYVFCAVVLFFVAAVR